MKITYLEYTRQVLEKVSFDQNLFQKELRKAMTNLLDVELQELQSWCRSLSGTQYEQIINECFSSQQIIHTMPYKYI